MNYQVKINKNLADHKGQLKTHNQKALRELSIQDPMVIGSNPEFFDPDVIDTFGFQKFEILKEDDERFLEVKRTIIYQGRCYELTAVRYKLDANSVIIKDNMRRVLKTVGKILPATLKIWEEHYDNINSSFVFKAPRREQK